MNYNTKKKVNESKRENINGCQKTKTFFKTEFNIYIYIYLVVSLIMACGERDGKDQTDFFFK